MLLSAYAFCSTKIFPLLSALFGLGIVITVHEFGHYFFAKLFNVHTPIFSIGFGPALIKKKIGTTEFRLSPLPLGGYCMIDGGSEAELDLPGESITRPAGEDILTDKASWQKLLIMFGGIFFNIIFAYAIFAHRYMGTRPVTQPRATISYVKPNSPAKTSGLTAGDIIVGYNINSDKLTRFTDSETAPKDLQGFMRTIAQHPNETLTLEIERNGTTSTKEITLGTNKEIGTLGVSIDIQHAPVGSKTVTHSFTQAVRKGIAKTHQWITQTTSGIFSMFKKRSVQGMGGPVALISQGFRVSRNGLLAFLSMLAIISINLAIINLIPFGPLDGSQIMMVTIEAIIRRPLSNRFKEIIMLGGWIVLASLILYLTYQDLLRVFGW